MGQQGRTLRALTSLYHLSCAWTRYDGWTWNNDGSSAKNGVLNDGDPFNSSSNAVLKKCSQTSISTSSFTLQHGQCRRSWFLYVPRSVYQWYRDLHCTISFALYYSTASCWLYDPFNFLSYNAISLWYFLSHLAVASLALPFSFQATLF